MAVSGRWHVPSRPGWQGIRIADPAESVDQPRQATEPKASQLARLKATDHALIDSGQPLQLALGESDPFAPTANQPADPSVSTRRANIGVLHCERFPGHLPMMTMPSYPSLICGAVRRRTHRIGAEDEGAPSSMHVGCIGPSAGARAAKPRRDAGPSGAVHRSACHASERHRMGEVYLPPHQRASGSRERPAAARGASVRPVPFVPVGPRSRIGDSPMHP